MPRPRLGTRLSRTSVWGVTWSQVVSSFPDWRLEHWAWERDVQELESGPSGWMEFRDRSTHAVREREVLYRLIVR